MTDKHDLWHENKKISVIVDPPGWFTRFGNELVYRLTDAGQDAMLIENQVDVPVGDLAFYLSCSDITPAERLQRNLWNIVVHASDLPHGRGFSPLVWQILEGTNKIPVSMITMTEDVDGGDILMRRVLNFGGYELNDEMRDAMGKLIVDMCFEAATAQKAPISMPQVGKPSWFRRRRPDDSRLDVDKSLRDQFDLLRVVDNSHYPAFFELNGHRYVLKIERVNS